MMEVCDIPCAFNNAISQNFLFPKPIIKYILDNASRESYAKLYETCKYFYIKSRKINVILLDLLSDDMGYDYPVFLIIIKTGSGAISYRHINMKNFKLLKKSLWLSKFLFLYHPVAELIPKIVECDLSYLQIGDEITYDEFKFLTKAGNIKQLYLLPNKIFYPQNVRVPLDGILNHVLNAYIIYIRTVILTNDILNKLLKMEYQVKIEKLALHNINYDCDINLLNQFLKKALSNHSIFYLSFDNPGMNKSLIENICEKINLWSPEERKPLNMPNLEVYDGFFFDERMEKE